MPGDLQVESLTSWLLGKETEQEALPVHDDPVLHSSEVNSRLGEVSYLGGVHQQCKS